jgi:hypothetical protein
MKIEIEKNELLLLWSDVNESLEIMKALEKNEIKKPDLMPALKNGSLRLARVLKKLDKYSGMKAD